MIRTLTVVIADGTVPPGTVPPAVPTEQPIAVARGEDQAIRLNVIHADYSPFDITGCDIRLAVRRWLSDESAMFTRAADPVGLPAAGIAQVVIPSIDTLGLTEKKRYWYDVEVTDGSGHRWQGVLVSGYHINPIVSQPGEPILPPLVDTGAPIAIGPPGPAGLSILNGIGVPDSALGRDGEWYIDRTVPTALVMYGPKTAGAWGTGHAFGGGGSGSVISTSDPLPGGLVAHPGTGSEVSAWDHVHPYTLAVASGANGWMSGAMAQQLADLVTANYGAAISTVAGNLAALTTTVSGHTSTLASHTSSIAANAGAISTLQGIDLIAGAGLTGGGTLSGVNRTFNVGQNADNSITVNANDIQVSSALQTAISTNTSNISSLTTTVGSHTTLLATASFIVRGASNAPANAQILNDIGTGYVRNTLTTEGDDDEFHVGRLSTVATIPYTDVTGGPSTSAKFLVQVAHASIPSAQAMGALGTGVVKNTTSTGVQSIAVANTDFAHPGATYVVQTGANAPGSAQVLGSLGTGVLLSTTSTGVLSIAAAADIPSLLTTKGDLLGFSTVPARVAVAATDGWVLTVDVASTPGWKWAAVPARAPTTSKYLLQVADAALPSAQAMGALATGLVKNTTTTGVQSIAVANTDYAHPSATYIVQTSTSAPGSAQVLASLASGILKTTTATGVLSVAAAADIPSLLTTKGDLLGYSTLPLRVPVAATDGWVLTVDAASAAGWKWAAAAGGGGGGYTTIDANGTPLTARSVLNFSSTFGAVDNSGATRTDITIASAGITAAMLASTAVTPASYTYGSFTVDAQGRITAASSGVAPITAHSGLSGLTGSDDHTQYALLAGRSGGQTFEGDTATGGNLTLSSTHHATKGFVYLGSSTGGVYDQTNVRFGIGGAPTVELDITKTSASGGTVSALLFNASNTASATARFTIKVGGATAGNPVLTLDPGAGGTPFDLLVDNQSSDKFQVQRSGANYITVNPGNSITLAAGGTANNNVITTFTSVSGNQPAGALIEAGGLASGRALILTPDVSNTTGAFLCLMVNDATAGGMKRVLTAANRAGPPILNLIENGGQLTSLATNTVASASGAIWDGRDYQAATLTLSGSTNVTTATGVNMVDVKTPTITSASPITVSFAATLHIAAAPVAAGSTTITKAYSLWIDAGLPRIDSTTANGSVATTLGSVGPVGSNTTVQEWLTVDINGTTRFLPCF